MLSQGSVEAIQSVKCFCTHVKTGCNSILPPLGSRYRWLLGLSGLPFQPVSSSLMTELPPKSWKTPHQKLTSDLIPIYINCLLKIFIYMWEACGGQRTTCWSQFPFSHMFYRDLVHQLSCKHSYSLRHPADPKKGEFNGRMLSFSELFTSIGSEK